MSLFRNTRWSRREVLKQSGILSALGAANAVSPFAAGGAALAEPAQRTRFPPERARIKTTSLPESAFAP